MIKATLPKEETLAGQTLVRLMQGRQLTHRDFQTESATYRLSVYIEHLRKTHNWIIQTDYEEEATTSNPTGRNTTYGRYSIEPELLAEYREQISTERFDAFIEVVKQFEAKGEK
jgi:hypothetical protein